MWAAGRRRPSPLYQLPFTKKTPGSAASHTSSAQRVTVQLYLWGKRTASRPILPQYYSPSNDVDMMKWLLHFPSALFCCCISLCKKSLGVLFSCEHRWIWQCQWCLQRDCVWIIQHSAQCCFLFPFLYEIKSQGKFNWTYFDHKWQFRRVWT